MSQKLNCYKDPFGYYLDTNISLYKKCNNYYYFDENDKYQCTKEKKCPVKYNKFIPSKNQCIKKCDKDNIFKYEFRKICYKQCPSPNSTLSNITPFFCEAICSKEFPYKKISTQECLEICDFDEIRNKYCIYQYSKIQKNETNSVEQEKQAKQEEIEEKNKLIESSKNSITDGKINSTKLDNGEEEKFSDDKMTITLGTTDTQKENVKDNNTRVDLGECEIILRNYYNITKDKSIYMQKIDVVQEGFKIPKVEISVFAKIDDIKSIKLNLSLCQNSKMDISIPVVLNEDIDKLNTSSGYYNDPCYTSTTEAGTDIILKDRKQEFIDGNKTVCQEDCDFTGYDYSIQKAKCSCKVKESSDSFADMNIDRNGFFADFSFNFKSIANINLLVCYKVLFTIKGIFKNIGSVMIICITIFHFFCIVNFYQKQFIKIDKDINDIVFGINNWKLVINENKEKRRKAKELKIKQ